MISLLGGGGGGSSDTPLTALSENPGIKAVFASVTYHHLANADVQQLSDDVIAFLNACADEIGLACKEDRFLNLFSLGESFDHDDKIKAQIVLAVTLRVMVKSRLAIALQSAVSRVCAQISTSTFSEGMAGGFVSIMERGGVFEYDESKSWITLSHATCEKLVVFTGREDLELPPNAHLLLLKQWPKPEM